MALVAGAGSIAPMSMAGIQDAMRRLDESRSAHGLRALAICGVLNIAVTFLELAISQQKGPCDFVGFNIPEVNWAWSE